MISARPLEVKLTTKKTKKTKKAGVSLEAVERRQGRKNKEREPMERIAKDDTSWISSLHPGKHQKHVFVSGLPFETSSSMVRKFFEKCGTVVAIYMPPARKNQNSHLAEKLKDKSKGHRGEAIIKYQDNYGVREATMLDKIMFRGAFVGILSYFFHLFLLFS